MQEQFYVGVYPNLPMELVLTTQDQIIFVQACLIAEEYDLRGLIGHRITRVNEWSSRIVAINPPLPSPGLALIVVAREIMLYQPLLKRLAVNSLIANNVLMEINWRLSTL